MTTYTFITPDGKYRVTLTGKTIGAVYRKYLQVLKEMGYSTESSVA